MIKTKTLQGIMRKNDITIEILAKKLSLSRTGLFNKIHGMKEFSAKEIKEMIEIFHLNDEEIRDIFFCN